MFGEIHTASLSFGVFFWGPGKKTIGSLERPWRSLKPQYTWRKHFACNSWKAVLHLKPRGAGTMVCQNNYNPASLRSFKKQPPHWTMSLMIEQHLPVLRTFYSSEWRTGLTVLFQSKGQHTLLMSLCETNSPTWGQLGRQASSEAEQWVSISGSFNLIREKMGAPFLNHLWPIFSLFLPSPHLSLLIFSLSCSVKIWAGQHT